MYALAADMDKIAANVRFHHVLVPTACTTLLRPRLILFMRSTVLKLALYTAKTCGWARFHVLC